jgi:tetratricopeptide (TPR) repeat protein
MEADVRRVRALIRHARGGADEDLVDELNRMLELARRIQDPQVLVAALAVAARIFVQLGRIDQARELADELGSVAHLESGYVAELGLVASELGAEELVRNAMAKTPANDPWRQAAEAMLEGDYVRAADILIAADRHYMQAELRLRAAQALFAQGRQEEADEQLERALAFSRSVGATRYVAEAEALRAHARTASGEAGASSSSAL